MLKIAWITDIHLNFLTLKQVSDFFRKIIDLSPDVILIGGDISAAPDVNNYLRMFEAEIQVPIYFVLGNHDFYYGSIEAVREEIKKSVEESDYLNWLPAAGIVKLTGSTCLIGHGSWADGRLGKYECSPVTLDDYSMIDEFKELNNVERFRKLNELGDEAGLFFQRILPEALDRFHNVLVLTHVPPFKESCWHEGQISDDSLLPHFSCKAVGEVLRSFMAARPNRQMTVLCGHCHSSGEAQILSNLKVKTGGSSYGEYYSPEIMFIE